MKTTLLYVCTVAAALLLAASQAQGQAPRSPVVEPPVAPVSQAFSDALANGIKLNIAGTLPGEGLLTALIQYASQVRSTMDPALLKKLDAITVQQLEDCQALWRSIWVQLGVIPK